MSCVLLHVRLVYCDGPQDRQGSQVVDPGSSATETFASQATHDVAPVAF